jgi:hypothetical protein
LNGTPCAADWSVGTTIASAQIRTTGRCGTRLANQSAACEDIAVERRGRQTPWSKKDLPARSLLFKSVPFRADCCGALKIRLSFAI